MLKTRRFGDSILLICLACSAGGLWHQFGDEFNSRLHARPQNVRLIEETKRLDSRLCEVIGELGQKLKNMKSDLDRTMDDLAQTKARLNVVADSLVTKAAHLQRYPVLLGHIDGTDTTNGQHFSSKTITLQAQHELTAYRRQEQVIRYSLEMLLSESEKQADIQREYVEGCRVQENLDRLQKRIRQLIEGAESGLPNLSNYVDNFTIRDFERELLDAEVFTRFLGG